MALILHMDTAMEGASVCLSKDGAVLSISKNENQKDHAAWLHPAVDRIMKDAIYSVKNLDAVAVTIGPGSYTGLRVGLAAAKGLCYTLNIPLLTIGTLEMMAVAAKNEAVDLLCPLIDARRMEVFTAIYDKTMKEIISPKAVIVEEKSFSDILSSNKVLFFGNGSLKLKNICKHENAVFKTITADTSHIIPLAEKRYSQKNFADLAYAEPLYLKEFYRAVR